MSSRYEKLMEAFVNGETADIVPRSRAEAALKNCIEGCGCDGLPEPKSRTEAYLQALAQKMAGGGGATVAEYDGTVEIADGGN